LSHPVRIQENDASPGVVSACADNLQKVKGLWNPAYLVLNFWPSAKAFEDVCTSGECALLIRAGQTDE